MRRGERPARPTLERWAWLAAVPVAAALAGGLFATSATSARGTELRASGVTDLSSLVIERAAELDDLHRRTQQLTTEVSHLRRDLADTPRGAQLADRIAALRRAAGLTPVHGPGLTVTLDDAPDEAFASADVAPFNLVVHQQDIQAVANALWAGGAEAMTIQGQRIVSTTGIRCVGNTVVLHGRPYAPPYEITAIGPDDDMRQALSDSDYVSIYRQYTAAYGLGYDVASEDDVAMPGFTGGFSPTFARPAVS